jgi:hypothetical protein
VLFAFQIGLPRVIAGMLVSSSEPSSIASLKLRANFALMGTALALIIGRLEVKVGAVLSVGLGCGVVVDVPPHASKDSASNKAKNKPAKRLRCFTVDFLSLS